MCPTVDGLRPRILQKNFPKDFQKMLASLCPKPVLPDECCLLRYIATLLAFCMFLAGSAAHAAPLCQSGDRSIQLTILPPSGEPLALKVGAAYFDQRSIPRDGSSRGGLLLTMQNARRLAVDRCNNIILAPKAVVS